ncbi:MAG: AAA family ATPase, partial [Thermomicrobiales bacterium]
MVDLDPGRITVVGRANERALLSARLQAALSGNGSLFLLNGPSGSGKTTLLANLLADAREAGAVTAIGHSWDGGVAPPFDAWRQIVATLASQAGVDPALFPAPLGNGPRPDASAQLIQEVKAAFDTFARSTPLVIALDDLHVADPDALELLEYLTRDLRRLPILVAAAWRTDYLGPSNSLIDVLPRLRHDRRVELIQLGPLAYDDIVALTEWRAGPPAEELARYLLNRSDGNPLFVTELLRHLSARELLHPDTNGMLRAPSLDAGVPELLRQIVDQRVLLLGAEVESLIEIGAATGVEWELAVVEAVLGWPEERLLAALERAVSSQIIVLARESPETYRFTHALIREALLDRLVVRRRRQLHTRIAEALERLAETDA